MRTYRLCLTIFFAVALATVFGQTKKQTHLEFSVGFGTNNYVLKTSNWVQPPINYNDSLNSITSKSSVGLYLGISYYVKVSQKISLRPSATLLLPSTGKLVFERKTGKETVDLRSITEAISIPLNYKLSDKGFKPYLSFGPSFSFLLGQGDDTKSKVEFKTFNILGQIGIGGEKRFKQFKIKPELQYSIGFLEMRKNKNNIYNNTIGSLKANNFSLTFYFSDLLD